LILERCQLILIFKKIFLNNYPHNQSRKSSFWKEKKKKPNLTKMEETFGRWNKSNQILGKNVNVSFSGSTIREYA
jgi:hypothetical protein